MPEVRESRSVMSGRLSTRRRIAPSEAVQRIYEMTDEKLGGGASPGTGYSRSEIAKMLKLSSRTVANYRAKMREMSLAGAFEKKEPKQGFREVQPPQVIITDPEVLACLEDSPEGFERFFNRYAPLSDEAIERMMPHSKMFVQAAYRYCEVHDGTTDAALVADGLRRGETAEPFPADSAGEVIDGPERVEGRRSADAGTAGGQMALLRDQGEGPRVPAHPAGSHDRHHPHPRSGCRPKGGCGWKDSVVINVPPEHAKTTCFTVWMSVWRLCQHLGFRRLVISETQELARQFCGEVAQILEENELILADFGAFKTDETNVIWRGASYGAFRISGSKLTRGWSLLARGMDQQIQGLRADEVVVDDCIGPTDVQTKERRQKTSDMFHRTILSRLGPTGRAWVIGTRHHPGDIYGELSALRRDRVDPDERVWEHINFPAVLDWEDQTVLWPERWPYDKLMTQVYDRIGARSFSLVYQQDPLAVGSVLVQPDWIRGSDEDPDPRRGCLDRDRLWGPRRKPDGYVRVLSMDPMTWMAITVADVLVSDKTRFRPEVLEVVRKKAGMRDAMMEVERICEMYRPAYFILEVNAAQKAYRDDLQWMDVSKRYEVRLIPHTTGVNKLDKLSGLESLAVDFEMGRIRLPYGDVESRMQSKLLIDEATSYVPAVGDDKPQFSSDDVLDSLWFIKACLPKLLDRDRYHSDRVVQSFSSPFGEQERW